MGYTFKKWTVCGFTYEDGRRRERFRFPVNASTRKTAKDFVLHNYPERCHGLTLTAWPSGR